MERDLQYRQEIMYTLKEIRERQAYHEIKKYTGSKGNH